jgi:hypothetical protein
MKTIIEMAREAGFITSYGARETATDKLLERFAALVRADEKERIIKVIESMGTWAHINKVIDEVRGQA